MITVEKVRVYHGKQLCRFREDEPTKECSNLSTAEVLESQIAGEQRLPINKSIITSLFFSPF